MRERNAGWMYFGVFGYSTFGSPAWAAATRHGAMIPNQSINMDAFVCYFGTRESSRHRVLAFALQIMGKLAKVRHGKRSGEDRNTISCRIYNLDIGCYSHNNSNNTRSWR